VSSVVQRFNELTTKDTKVHEEKQFQEICRGMLNSIEKPTHLTV
jgi:hypothetical protein